VARLAGEIDISNAHDLGLNISSRVTNHTRAVIVDLSDVSYIDSSGLGVLFHLRRRLQSRRQALRIVAPPESPLRRVLHLVDLADTAAFDGSLDAALDGLDRLDRGAQEA
jgi:anti-anti-sigma factor